MNNTNVKMPIDQYGRYRVVADTITKLMKEKKQTKVKILDVGGYKGETHKFFPKDTVDITILDVFDVHKKNYVKGSAMALPFSENEFDYAVSFEVFEHIPREQRELFIKEATRVSKGAFILTAPFCGENDEVLKTEILVNNLWKSIHNQDHRWLKEHIAYKTPSTKEIEGIINKLGYDFEKIGNNDLVLWNLMTSFLTYSTLFDPTGLNPDIQAYYNNNANVLDADADEYYRYVYVLGPDSRLVHADTTKIAAKVNKVEVVNELVNKVFLRMSDLVLQYRQNEVRALHEENKELTQKLDQATAQLQQLNDEISMIKNTKSHKLAVKAGKLKKRLEH